MTKYNADTIEFYEYAINLKTCTFTKYKGVGIQLREGTYRAKFYLNNRFTGNNRLIHLTDFEQINSYRVLSFKDDTKFYNTLLVKEYENMLLRNIERTQKQETFLKNLKKLIE